MMKNKFWDKIKEFFKKIFGDKKERLALNTGSDYISNKEIKSDFLDEISVQKELENAEKQHQIAQKLLNYDLFPSELTEEETEEMIEWFTNDIEEKDKELEKVKNHIIAMKRQLEQM